MHRRFLNTDAFTRTHTQKLSNFSTKAFTHRSRSLYIEELLHTTAFTQGRLCTEDLLHTEAFTHRSFSHRSFCTEKSLHRGAFTQTLLHRGAFAQRSIYTEELLHAEASTHKNFYTEKSLHRRAFTQISLDADLHLKVQNFNFAPAFDVRPSFCAKGLHLIFQNCNCILHEFLTFEPHFMRKGDAVAQKIRISPQDPHDFRRGLRRKQKISPYVCASDTHDLCRVLLGHKQNSHFNTCSCVRHARPPQRVAFPSAELPLPPNERI